MALKAMNFVHFWIFTVKFKQIHKCNGLESNEKFFEKKLSGKTFLSKKIFGKNFLSLETFQSSEVQKCSEVCVKNSFTF